MKPKRILAILLLCAIIATFTACEKIDLSGGKDPSGGKDRGDPNVLTVRTTVTGEDTFRPEGGASSKAERILQSIVDAEKKTGYTIDAQIVAADTLTSGFLKACRAGGKYADVIQTEAWFLSQYYSEGYFLSLDTVGISPSETGVLTRGDKAYALRSDAWMNPVPSVSYVLYYNDKLFRDVALESPLGWYEAKAWNWTNFLQLCNNVTTAYSREVYAIAEPNEAETDLIWATLHAAGAKYFTADGTCTMDSAATANGFAKLRELLSAGITYRLGSEINDQADPTSKLAFINRRTAFFVGSSELLFETGEESLSENLGEDLRIIPFPAIAGTAAPAAYTRTDLFCGITKAANLSLCKELIPLLFTAEDTTAKDELIRDSFFHEKDAEIYFDLLKNADTETNLQMTDKYTMVEELFVQIVNGSSVKEYLSNLENIFNTQQKG